MNARIDAPVALNLGARSQLDSPVDFAALRRMPSPANRKGEWLLIGNHLHTVFSVTDGSQTLGQLISRAQAAKLDGMILTDHNSMKGAETQDFQDAPIVMIKGMEWGAWREKGETVVGHAALIELEGNEPLPTYASLEQMLSISKSRNAYIVANHPFNRGNAWQAAVPQPEVDGIEVWNGFWALVDPVMHNNDAKNWWAKQLHADRRLTALGGSDSHGQWYDDPSRGANLVFATDRSATGIMAGIRAGHVSVVADSKASRIVLEADAARDNTWQTLQGDEIVVNSPARIPMRAHVIGGKGLTVEFYGKAGRLGATKIEQNDQIVSFEAVGIPGVPDFVRVELKRHPGKWWSMSAMTNPIYLR